MAGLAFLLCFYCIGRVKVLAGAEAEGGEGGDDLLGFVGDGDDLLDEAEDAGGVVDFFLWGIRVVDDVGVNERGEPLISPQTT